MKRTPTIRTVAERAGVSTATVSNVLNGKPASSALVARVRFAVDELGYVADPHASRLRSGRHALCGVVVPDLANPMFGSFVSTVERLARNDGYDLLVVSSANSPLQEAERLQAIHSWRPAGLIVIPCDGGLASRLPRGATPPVVVADRIPDDPAFDVVAVDNARAASCIAAHLGAQGYRTCLVAGSSRGISNIRERWEGAVTAAGGMSLTLLEVGLDAAQVRDAIRCHLATAARTDALFTLDHATTLVAYRLVSELGLRVPHDLGFASFDETEWMRLVQPPLTAVCQPIEAMATAAWVQLQRRIGGDRGAPLEARLECAVHLRASTHGFREQRSAAA